MGIFRKWGIGVEMTFEDGRARAGMRESGRSVVQLRRGYERLGVAQDRIADGATRLGAALAPIGLLFGAGAFRASSLASDLEGAALSMRVLVGDATKADALLEQIRMNAAATPFAEGDLIDGSRRLLRLTGSNVDRNLELLKLVEKMVAIQPDKQISDAAEAILDASAGGGFERLKEFGIPLRATMFEDAGETGGKAWGEAVVRAIESTVEDRLNGEDIVEALSKTFRGRVSTLVDSVDNLLRSAGKRINERLKPIMVSATASIQGLEEPFVAAIENLADSIDTFATRATPVLEWIREWWKDLGTEGQTAVIQGVIAFGALSTALVGGGAGLAIVGTGLSGVLSILSAVGPAVSGLGLIVTGAAGSLGGLSTALGGVATAALGVAGLGGTSGLAGMVGALLGPVGALAVALAAVGASGAVVLGVLDHAAMISSYLSTLFVALGDGVLRGFGPLDDVVAPLLPTLERLRETVSNLVEAFFGAGPTVGIWQGIGYAIGVVGRMIADLVVGAVDVLLTVIDVAIGALGPFLIALTQIGEAFFGWITGARKGEDALKSLISAIGGLLASFALGLASFATGVVEILLRAAAGVIRAIPGAEALLGSDFSLGANSVAAFRKDLEEAALEAVAGVDRAADGRAEAEAQAGAPLVNVTTGDTIVSPSVESRVEIDGREVARANGRAAVDGAKRSGRKVRPDRRGSVLRGNGTIEYLDASEAFGRG